MNQRKIIGILLICAAVLLLAMVTLLILQNSAGQAPAPSPEPEVSEPVPVSSLVSTGATDTIRQFFGYWNEKDTSGMEACRTENNRGQYNYDELSNEGAIVLNAMYEQDPAQSDFQFDEAWFPNPAAIALVLVDYTVQYNDEGEALYLTSGYQSNGFPFWLVKESEDSVWLIAAQGY